MRTINLLPLLALLCLLGASNAQYSSGCYSIKQRPGHNSSLPCNLCYERQANYPASEGCGRHLYNNCALYISSPNNDCYQCKPGYALNTNNKACVGGTIQGCVAEYTDRYNRHRCYGCSNGQYAQLEDDSDQVKRCIPASQVENPIENCLYGGEYRRSQSPSNHTHLSGVITCFRCE